MEVFLKKDGVGYYPMYGYDYDSCKKHKQGAEVKGILTVPRNLKFHKKFFALMTFCYQNQDYYSSVKILRAILTMQAGFYEEVKTLKGVVYWPASISFDSMDDVEFGDFYSKVVDQVIKMIGVTSEEIERELINFF